MLSLSIITIVTVIPIIYFFILQLLNHKVMCTPFRWKYKFNIFIVVILLDILIVIYSTIEPPLKTKVKNGIDFTIGALNDLILYMIAYYIIKLASKKEDKKQEFLLTIKGIWAIGVLISFLHLINMIF